MAGLIHLELLTDFFNKIGPALQILRCKRLSAFRVTAEVTGRHLKRRQRDTRVASFQGKPSSTYPSGTPALRMTSETRSRCAR